MRRRLDHENSHYPRQDHGHDAQRLRQIPRDSQGNPFGSRATGRATERSDIDLVTCGITDRYEVAKIRFALEDLPIPQICEIQPYERITHESLRRHIDTHGIVIYSRESEAAEQASDQSAQAVT